MLKKSNRGKEKGSGFEREFCKQFSLWFTRGCNAKAFWRAPSSGAMATQNKNKTNEHFNPGDVIGCSPEAVSLMKHLVIELKRGYDYDFSDLVTLHKKSCPLLSFIEQLEGEMQQHGCMFGFLVLKQDRKPAIIVMPNETYVKLFGESSSPLDGTARFMIKDSIFFAVSLYFFLLYTDPRVFYNIVTGRKDS